MSDSFITQCPHCHTSFRVNQHQLTAAQGAVRCGACLHVFNAHQHMLEKPPITPPAVAAIPPNAPPLEQATSATPPRKNPLDTLWIHDDLDLDSLDLDEELTRLEQEELRQTQPMAPPPNAPQQPVTGKTPTAATTDERWAEQLLDEPNAAARTHTTPPAVVAVELTKLAPNAVLPVSTLSAEPAENLDPQVDEELDSDAETTHATLEEIELTSAGHQSTPTAHQNPATNLFDLSDDPLQLQWQAPSKPWGRWLGWGMLNLLAAGALVAQYSIYHFDELARQDQYRPWFESICPQLGCNLPPKVDVELIKSSNLVVRSHPEFAGALVVDAILYNRASFPQPFPLLELRFSDMNNKLLANRRFKPGEYLSGELAGRTEMPPQTPIHISLDILDPGQEAVNYSLTFQSPE